MNNFEFNWPVLYVAASGPQNGNGHSKDTPLVCPDLDKLNDGRLAGDWEVVLFPGVYETTGLKIHRRFRLRGITGKREDVIIKINASKNLKMFSPSFPIIQTFVSVNWCFLFCVEDVTLDGNWEALGDQVNTLRFKVQPIAVRCSRGLVRNVVIRNFGANGINANLPSGNEAFPLMLQTFSGGPPWNYLEQYSQLKGSDSERGYLEYRDCLIEKGFFTPGGYCTGINVVTNQGTAFGDRQEFGVRETLAARVINCVVRDIPYSAGLGIANAEMVEFLDNTIENVALGFNFDTGQAKSIVIRNNRFLNVSTGAQFITWLGASNINLSRNVFDLKGPWFNPVSNTNNPFFGVSVKGPSEGVQVRDNIFICPQHPDLSLFEGVTDTSSNKVFIQGSNDQLNKELAMVRSELEQEQRLRLEFSKEVNELLNNAKSAIGRIRESVEFAETIIF